MSRDKITETLKAISKCMAEQSKVAREVSCQAVPRKRVLYGELLTSFRVGQDRVPENTILREGWSS